MFTVKNFKVTYNSVNGKDIFTNGDWVSGQVTLEVAKDCQINYLFIKFKGKAEVNWTERQGYGTVVYHSKQKYFSLKHYFIRDKTLTGRRDFIFEWKDVPCSFTGSNGKIVYLLEAKVSRSTWFTSKDSTKINVVSKADLTPQHKSMEKKFNLFTSGAVTMTADIEKTGFFQGEGLKVVVRIINKSSREIKPKYCVYRKHSFFANGERRLETKDILKDVGTAIAPSASKKVTRVITIPHDMEPSILNCNIIKVEYRLRVSSSVTRRLATQVCVPVLRDCAQKIIVYEALISELCSSKIGNKN
uniref:Arrestin C-terminal-like domain-containing protein n=1 Tax=Seriola dumerili TaxID=41447 RepID=A0A3B4UVK1_SERDU